MLSDKQSIILTGIMGVGIFVFGILDLLDNFVVLTVMTISFFAIVINLLYTKARGEDITPQEQEELGE
ncbi:hypothetical protein [Tamlana crocina]|uniref:Uncharacterized protein n=1 Tax=Tamlana crocina TaxID=393006 RepID=A0ABX1DE38_9FLAO|nr:hypothetical protein [Tamlana crocina]NJX16614.1 hypothetical protein [Tamlana crocina]